MAYYLSPFIGSGGVLADGTSDPVRPPVDTGFQSFNLSGTARKSGGKCLLWTPVPASHPDLVLLADDLDEPMPVSVRKKLENELRVTLAQTDRLRSIIVELLIFHGRTNDPARWKPFQAGVDGKYHLYLGGLLYEGPSVLNTIITEDWDCADDPSLDCDLTWALVENGSMWNIDTNRAELDARTNDDFGSARAETDLASADHYAEADVDISGGGARWGGVGVRFDASAATYYGAEEFGAQLTNHRRITEVTTGSRAVLSEEDPDGDTTANFRLEISGSSMEMFKDSVSVLTAMDSSITGNTRTGINGQSRNTGGGDPRPRFDNFEAADLAAAAAVYPPFPHRQRHRVRM